MPCDRLRDDISQNQRALELIEQRISLFEEFLSRNAIYLNDFAEQRSLTRKQDELIKRYRTIADDIDKCNSNISTAKSEKIKIGQQTEKLIQKHRLINAPVSGALLDWPLEDLEKRYEEIKNKQSQDEKNIEQQIAHHGENKNKAEKSLKKYRHIPDYAIEAVSYNEDRWELLEKEEKRNQQLLQEAKDKQHKADINYNRVEAEHKLHRESLKKEGWPEPLPLKEIKRDYDARRALINQKLDELGLRVKALEAEREKCQRDIHRILGIIESPASIIIQPPEGGWLGVDIDEQSSMYKRVKGEINRLREISVDIERRIKNDYKDRHMGIDNILGTLSITGCILDYETCYFVFERLTEQRRLLQENVRILTSHLEHLDTQKENVIYHAFAQGKRLHAEIKKISESSRVKLVPDKPRQQTLKNGIPDELDSYAEERIRSHVDACISEMRRVKQESELTEKIMRNIIETKLSDREILNQTIGQHTIDVRLLKVDASHVNTKLRTWESVLTDNSGGELFVSCFVLLSALMDYARKSILPEDTLGSGTKVMLIDNPFGKTSSNHLLDALIQVAKQFNMQMICLSDLSQSSITAKFALIYQLSVRPAMYSNKSYLKTDSLTPNVLLYKDGRLEHVSLRHEQMSLF